MGAMVRSTHSSFQIILLTDLCLHARQPHALHATHLVNNAVHHKYFTKSDAIAYYRELYDIGDIVGYVN